MEDQEIISIWKSLSKKMDENLVLNRKNAEHITQMKVRFLLASMKPIKIFTIFAGILWVLFVDTLIINLFHIANPFFLISAGIQVLLTKLSIGIYLYQLIVIQQVDISQPVVATQQTLAHLRSSTLWVARILFLQFPVWTTFYWNRSMLENGNVGLYILQIAVTLFFTFLSVWLFRNINYQNRNKRWFRLIVTGKEWSPLIQSMELLSEGEDYTVENKTANKNTAPQNKR